ncbi:MAG: S41 family peptidase [Candidatus Omnitrophota bacterium]
MSKFLKFTILAIVLFLFLFLALTEYDKLIVGKDASDAALYDQLDNFSEAINILRKEYVGPVDPTKLIHGAMRGMVSSLDDYSQFLEKGEYEELKSDAKGEFIGMGVEVSMKDGVLTVITPMDGSPAETAGIKPGDKIIKIDNNSTKSMSITEAVEKMRGEPGTMIILTIWRDNVDKVFDVMLRRAMVETRSIKKAEVLSGGIGYIKISEFQENTPRDLDEVLKVLESRGMTSLILDLRNNPGGLLETASDVAERFLPKDKVVVSIKSRLPKDSSTFRSSGRFYLKDYPLVVLVNAGSASASEVVAGAIQDNKRGVIIGTKTFGKASVQAVVPLKDGSAIRFTSAYYYTPNGRLIKKEGIIPDMVVESNDSKQLEAAIKYLGILNSDAK